MIKDFTTHENHSFLLDNNDPLFNYRNEFYLPQTKDEKPFIYLSGNSLGLQPKNVKSHVNNVLKSWEKYGVEGHNYGKNPWMPYHEKLSELTTNIVGANANEVVVMNSLTVNLHLLMVSFYRPTKNKNKILIEENAFPSDKYAVESQIKFHGYNQNEDLLILKSGSNSLISTDSILEYLDIHGSKIAMILLGGVNYYTGQLFDMQKITEKAHQYDCIVGFDLAHACGNIHLNLHEWDVDFAAWCGYKYLNGGPGAPSGVFINERFLKDSNINRFEGWWGHDKSSRFKMPLNFKPIVTAEAWQLSNPPILSMAALLASLKIFKNAGMKNLVSKSNLLTSYLEFLILEKLNKHIQIITPNKPNERGCQLSIKLKKPIKNITNILYKSGIISDWREPDVIRIAPVPLYNTFNDCYEFVNRFEKIIYG
jgi:kynureninase